MSDFKIFFKIVRAYKKIILIYVGVFMIMSVVMSMVNNDSSSAKSFAQKKLEIGVVDQDHSDYGKVFHNYFKKEHHLKQLSYDKEQIEEDMYWHALDYVIVIPKGFTDKMEKGDLKNTQISTIKNPGSVESQFFESELTMFNQKLTALTQTGETVGQAGNIMEDLKKEKTNVVPATFVNADRANKMGDFAQYVPYLFISVAVLVIGMILLTINQKEIKDRVECSSEPMKKRTMGILLGTVVSGVVVFLAAFLVLMILGGTKAFSDIRMPFYMVNMLCMLFFSLSLGFLAGNVTKGMDGLNGFVNVAGLGLCFLGGIFVPQEFFGKTISNVARFVPTYWYVKNNDMIGSMAKTSPAFYKDFAMNSGLILLFAIAVFAVTLVISQAKRRTK